MESTHTYYPFYGTVKCYDNEKGFGFIYHGKDELFFHITDMLYQNPKPHKGDKVGFMRIKTNNKGKRAEDIVIVEDEKQCQSD